MRSKIISFILIYGLGQTGILNGQNELRTKFGLGYFNNPWNGLAKSKYRNPRIGEFFCFALESDINNILSIRMAMFNGNHRYFDSGIYTNDPYHPSSLYPDGTNSTAYNLMVGVELMVSLISTQRIKAQSGLGIGILNYVRRFTTKSEYDLGPSHIIRWNQYDQHAFNEIIFPISLTLSYKLNEIIGLFIDSGAYVEPDFPVMGLHAGLGILVAFQ